MKLGELTFRQTLERYLVLKCTWERLYADLEEFPWPAEADAVLVFVRDDYGEGASLEVLCPVISRSMEILEDKTPEKVHDHGCGFGTDIDESLLSLETIIPNQEAMAARGMLDDHVFPSSAARRRMLAATGIDKLRTLLNYDTFETHVDCGVHGRIPARVRMEDCVDGVFTGTLLDMLDDEIDVYENDKLEIRIEGKDPTGMPLLVARKPPRRKERQPLGVELNDTQKAALDLWVNGIGNSAKRFAGKDPLPHQAEKATKDSWRIRPMPSRHEDFHLRLKISAAEKAVLEHGYIPDAMEDHWFMYCEDDVLHYHRSWTGYCIFEARIEPADEGFAVTDARVNRYPGHYRETSIERDRFLLASLIAGEIGRR